MVGVRRAFAFREGVFERQQGVLRLALEIFVDHFPDELAERDFRLPMKFAARFGRVAREDIGFSRTKEALIFPHVVAVVQISFRKGVLAELTNRVRLSGSNHVIAGLGLLQHQPHRFDILTRMSPIPFRFEVPEWQGGGVSDDNAGDAGRDLTGDELEAAAGRFVVKEDSAYGEEVVRFTVITCQLVAAHLADAVARPRK